MHRTRARSLGFSMVITAAVATLLGDAATAQTPLGTPDATLPDDFGLIQTVRELPDGRVLVADPLGNALYVVDMDERTRTVIGREGQGPGEYRQPDAVWALPDGETLVVDLGNGRLHYLGADLEFGETAPIAMGMPTPGQPFVTAMPQSVDGQGRVYARSLGGGMRGGDLPDSASVFRIDPNTREQVAVATIKLEDRTVERSGSGGEQNVRMSSVPLSAQDTWGVAPDGSIAVARVGEFHIEWISPDGSVTRGPAIPYDAVRIGTGEKEEFVLASSRSGGGVGISVEMTSGGAVQMSFSRMGGSGRGPREIDQYTWPDEKPPFYGGRIMVDGEGRAWLRRHVRAGADATYDVFDRRGRRVGTVTLANNKQIVGFGSDTVYAVAFDEVDLAYLERYSMPSM